MLDVEGESDFTAELVAPGNKERNPPHQRKRSVYERLRSKEMTTVLRCPKDKTVSYVIMDHSCLGSIFFFFF